MSSRSARAIRWPVTLILDSDADCPVRWVLARDLLAEGLIARAGDDGDVQVWPDYGEDGRHSLWIRVGNARCTALFEVPAQPVAQWLAGSYAMVPRGREMADVDWGEPAQLIQ